MIPVTRSCAAPLQVLRSQLLGLGIQVGAGIVYATDADPRTMALMIAGGCREALDELKRQMEGTS